MTGCRPVRAVAATVLTCAVTLGPAVLAGAAPQIVPAGTTPQSAPAQADSPAAADLSPLGKRAFTEVATCVNSSERSALDVLYLVDVSASLKRTDPQRVRADLLGQSVVELARLADDDTAVSYAVATFGERYTPLNGGRWTQVNPGGAEAEGRRMRDLINGIDDASLEQLTNWTLGISGAQSAIAQSPGGARGCRAIVWLSDGGIDLDNRPGATTTTRTEQGLRELCATEGPIATLRRDGVPVLGVLLSDPSALTGKDRDNELSAQSYMQAVVEGATPDGTVDATLFGGQRRAAFACGFKAGGSIPAGEAPGALLKATDPIALAMQFAQLGALVREGTPGVVGGTPGETTFAVDPGIASFELVVPGATWQLVNPAGEVVATEAGATVSGVESATEGGIGRVEVPVRPGAEGTWTVTHADQQRRAAVFFFSGLDVALVDAGLTTGQDATVTVEVRRDGAPAPVDVYRTVSLTVGAVDPQTGAPLDAVAMSPSSGSSFGGAFTPPEGVGQVSFIVRLDVTTRSGVALEPIERAFTVPVTLPAQFPSLAPPLEITMTDLIGRDGAATGQFTVLGPKEGAGSVCLLTPSVLQHPPQRTPQSYAWRFSPRGEDGCLPLAAGMEQVIDVTVTNPVAASGVVTASIPLEMRSDGGGQPIPVDVAVSFQSIRPPANPGILAALLIAGLLFPVILLYAANFIAARLRLAGVQVARVPVSLGGTGSLITITRQSSTAPGSGGVRPPSVPAGASPPQPPAGLVTAADLSFLPLGSSGRTARVGTETLTARVSFNPFEAVRGRVTPPSGVRVLSNDDPPELRGGMCAGVPLNPAGAFYLLMREDDLRSTEDPMKAELVAFLRPTAVDAAQVIDRLNRAVTTFAGLAVGVAGLRQSVRGAPAEAAKGNGVGRASRTKAKPEADGEATSTGTGGGRPPGPPQPPVGPGGGRPPGPPQPPVGPGGGGRPPGPPQPPVGPGGGGGRPPTPPGAA